MKRFFYLVVILFSVAILSSCEKEDNTLANTRWESKLCGALEFFENGRVVQDYNGIRHEGKYKFKEGTISFNLSGFILTGYAGPYIEIVYPAEAIVEFQKGTSYLSSMVIQVMITSITDKYPVPEAEKAKLIGKTFSDVEFLKVQ